MDDPEARIWRNEGPDAQRVQVDADPWVPGRGNRSLGAGKGLPSRLSKAFSEIGQRWGQGLYETIDKPRQALAGEWSPFDAEGHISEEAAGWGFDAAGMAMTGGVGGAPSGAIGAGPTRRLETSDLPNLRELSAAEGAKIASKDPHLLPSASSSEGAYVGGPRDVKTKRDLTKIRSKLDDTILQGAPGGNWYDRTRAGITEITGVIPSARTGARKPKGNGRRGLIRVASFSLRPRNGTPLSPVSR